MNFQWIRKSNWMASNSRCKPTAKGWNAWWSMLIDAVPPIICIWEFEQHHKMADSLVLYSEYSEHDLNEGEDRWSTISWFSLCKCDTLVSSLASYLLPARMRELRGRKHPALLTLSSSRVSTSPHCMTQEWYLGHGRRGDVRKHVLCQLCGKHPLRTSTQAYE